MMHNAFIRLHGHYTIAQADCACIHTHFIVHCTSKLHLHSLSAILQVESHEPQFYKANLVLVPYKSTIVLHVLMLK